MFWLSGARFGQKEAMGAMRSGRLMRLLYHIGISKGGSRGKGMAMSLGLGGGRMVDQPEGLLFPGEHNSMPAKKGVLLPRKLSAQIAGSRQRGFFENCNSQEMCAFSTLLLAGRLAQNLQGSKLWATWIAKDCPGRRTKQCGKLLGRNNVLPKSFPHCRAQFKY